MSVSKWAYTPEKCEGDYCVGDCDLCSKAGETEETECCYPNCEECDKYVSLGDDKYCTVPIIVSKEMWMLLTDRLDAIEKHTTHIGSALWALAMDFMERLP